MQERNQRMKFKSIHKQYFNASEGTYSIVTERENFDSQITITGSEADLVIKYFGNDELHVGKVSLNPDLSTKKFLLYPRFKEVNLNVVFPKPNKKELRLYLSSAKGFKPKKDYIWFLYLDVDSRLVIGTMSQDEWARLENKKEMKKHKSESLKTSFNGVDVFTQPMKVIDILTLYYVAVRGRDNEDGAVQRLLSTARVKQIREYVLLGKNFFNTFIFNWTDTVNSIIYSNGEITIPIVPGAAQVLDGQHRLAGLEAAVEIDQEVGQRTILVSFTIGLKTKAAAEIFLNINTEQKPVPKSLIYDLFGVVDNDKEHAVNRAMDIAHELNSNETSPYYKLIKFPGNPIGVGIVDLSTFVTTLKAYLKTDGIFFNYNITDLGRQKQIFLNYFSAIKSSYDRKDMWFLKSKNPFLQSAGVVAAIEFFSEKLLLKCSDKKSFSVQTFKEFLNLDASELLTQASVKGTDGKSARAVIKDYLDQNLLADAPEQDEYEF